MEEVTAVQKEKAGPCMLQRYQSIGSLEIEMAFQNLNLGEENMSLYTEVTQSLTVGFLEKQAGLGQEGIFSRGNFKDCCMLRALCPQHSRSGDIKEAIA